MEINKDVIKHVAEIARLNLSEKEVEEFLPELREVLKYFEILGKLDTKNVKPSFQAVDLKNVMREDKARESLKQEEVLNVKNKKDGYFLGPKVV